MDNLTTVVDQMKNMSHWLIPYTYPQNDAQLEEDIRPLKTREAVIDGYSLMLYFSRALYEDYYIESFQVLGMHAPFLSFGLVVKLAKRFLGNENLSLIEVIHENRKIYCWNVILDRENGETIPMPQEKSEYCTYEGFKYLYMDPTQVDLH